MDYLFRLNIIVASILCNTSYIIPDMFFQEQDNTANCWFYYSNNILQKTLKYIA